MATTYNLVPIWDIPFTDLNGKILSYGKLYTFKSTAHSVEKPVYEDATGATTYPNPIILDARGCIPGTPYWASDENYYIELKDINGISIKTKDNYNASWLSDPTPGHEDVDFTNYMLNAQFRLPLQLKFENDDLPDSSTIIAEEGWTFYRDNTSADIEIEFLPFTAGQTSIPDNPKYWVQFKSNTTGAAETKKDFVFNVGDVTSFSRGTIQYAIWAWSSLSSTIELVVRQFFGTGGSATVETVNGITLTNAETQYPISIDVPDVAGKTITSDNRLEIILRMPLNQISNVNFSTAQINRGVQLLEFNYLSYEQERTRAAAYLLPIPTDDDIYGSLYWDAANHRWSINTETGKVDWFLLSDAPTGYLPMDGSTYVRTETITDTKITYERLYTVWENDATLLNGNAFGYGEDGFWPYINGNLITFINNKPGEIDGWSDNDTGFTVERIEAGEDPLFNVEYEAVYDESLVSPLNKIRITNLYDGDVTNIDAADSGFTVLVYQHGTTVLPEISFLTSTDSTGLEGKHFKVYAANGGPMLKYAYWFTVDGVGAKPVIPTFNIVEVALMSIDTAEVVAEKIMHVMNGKQQTKIITNDAASVTGGEYFLLNNDAQPFYLWLTKDDVGDDPAVIGSTGIRCDLLGTDTDSEVATKVAKAISSYYFVVPDYRGYFVRITDNGAERDPEVDTRIGNGAAFSGDKVGTSQNDTIRSHRHPYIHVTDVGNDIAAGSSDNRNGPTITGFYGATETRPINRYLNAFVKF